MHQQAYLSGNLKAKSNLKTDIPFCLVVVVPAKQMLDRHLDGRYLRFHDFSGVTKNCLSLEFWVYINILENENVQNTSIIPGKLFI